MTTPSDPDCEEKGIPPHLHMLERLPQPLDQGERVYRFFRLNAEEDLTQAISFKYKRSSVNRAHFCHEAEDVLWDDERGGRREGYGVVTFPGDVFTGQEWKVDDGTGVFRVSINHEPKRCNYAHCSIVVTRDTSQVDDIKPKSVKLKIREWLQGKVLIQVPLDREGEIMPLERNGPQAEPCPPHSTTRERVLRRGLQGGGNRG
jgi:hypothetical protein